MRHNHRDASSSQGGQRKSIDSRDDVIKSALHGFRMNEQRVTFALTVAQPE